MNCLWCSNPELINPYPDLLYSHDKCVSCGTCISVCPHNALSLDNDNLILIDRKKCQASGECVEACPEGALELVGREVTVDRLVDELLKDRVFYETSGGGVTFSGGEPLSQSGFVRKVAKRLQAKGIHTALDTAGDVPWDHFEEVLDVIDLFLYDIKIMGSEQHQRLTGRDNDLVIANARMLGLRNVPMHIRLVVVPGMNDSLEELSARMEFACELESVTQIDLLPYHRYGVGKYARLGLDYPLKEIEEHTEDEVDVMCKHLESYGIPVTVGG